MNSIELFAGAGGLAMGMARAGFHHTGLIEWNQYACQTIRENPHHYSDVLGNWPLHQCDARTVTYGDLGKDVMVVSGGPPCQPFSLGGKHGGFLDERDMFPEAVRSIRELRPKAFVFENVKGLLRSSFAEYFEYITLQLTYPEMVRQADEPWLDHLGRLERQHTSGRRRKGTTYNVVFRLLNAANYGVPQKRERVFIVGFRSDLNIEWSFPDETHSEEALLHSQWITGEYWERHKVARQNRPTLSARHAPRVARLRTTNPTALLAPWLTVRDAISDLPDPERYPNSRIPNHVFIPGARSYPGHTGSPLDEPSKTLKAGDHGVPGGENMLARPDGSIRYFTVREAARLQTFPDDYIFHGSWGETMRQLGNAVPVRLAEVVARSVAAKLDPPGA
jgi:DNA (cytosine-5)-methyltransferase 1